jgi:hypothetical protein
MEISGFASCAALCNMVFTKSRFETIGTRILRHGERKTNRQHKLHGVDGVFPSFYGGNRAVRVFRVQKEDFVKRS